MTLKKNRSNKFTTGLCNTFKDITLRTLFFELDKEHLEHYTLINQVFRHNRLDYFTHKTGSGGMHFLTPTMITKERWKSIMSELKFINQKCPMTTLRVKPNKYFDEDQYWYFVYTEEHYENETHNSKEMCDYFNRVFKTKFVGKCTGEIKIVHYPLPFVGVKNEWIT